MGPGILKPSIFGRREEKEAWRDAAALAGKPRYLNGHAFETAPGPSRASGPLHYNVQGVRSPSKREDFERCSVRSPERVHPERQEVPLVLGPGPGA